MSNPPVKANQKDIDIGLARRTATEIIAKQTDGYDVEQNILLARVA